ncbi:MAG: acyltransferase [Acidobacteria bacterium]|nr:acyltransferase [Acidobacteriota bacterium]
MAETRVVGRAGDLDGLAPPSPATTGYRPDIDGLRALAVGLVLLYHGFPSFVPGGFIGVDVFFVISGYLITGILLRARDRVRARRYFLDFYERRVRRIFPALLLVLIACGTYGWFRLFPADYQNLTQYIAGGASFVDNLVVWSQTNYFDASAATKPLIHLWSLAIEEQFYIVWPLLILVFGRLTRGRFYPVLFAVLAVSSLAYSVVLTSTDPTAAYYSPFSRGWELAAGGLVAAMHTRGWSAKPGRRADVITIVALLLIVAGALFVVDSAHFPGWEALLPVVATAAVIWFGAGSIVDRRLLGTRLIVTLGLISYPLYLWHWVVLTFLRIEDPAPPGWLTLLALVVSVGLAAATYFLLELPLRRPRLRTVSISLLATMGAVLTFALFATTMQWSGVALTSTQKALSNTYNPQPAYRYRTCFLDSATQTASDFTPSCAADGPAGDPTLLLWGDSLTAQLYPGLESRGRALGYRLVQRTASSCPPELDNQYSDRGNCNEINASTRAYIRKTRPAAVVINGRWPDDETQRNAQISAISVFLRQNGVKTVILVGPAPDWAPDLRGILIRETFPHDTLPLTMTPPASTWPGTQAEDASLAALSARIGAEYLSLVARLCTGDQCRIRVSGDIPAGLVASDHDHLTAQASRFVLKDFSVKPPLG